MEENTTTVMMEEVLKGVATDIVHVARARVWWPLRRVRLPLAVWRALRLQDSVRTPQIEQTLEPLIDRLLATVLEAFKTQPLPQSTPQNR